MSDRMIPIPFHHLVEWVLTEKKSKDTVFGVHRPYLRKGKKSLSLFHGKIETPFGPAAGPNTQLAQNIIASYYTGSRFFELKTVQMLDGEDLPVAKPCILAADEGYNVEWSTELTVQQAFDEYVKAWWVCKLISLEFELGDPDGFLFNMSVGYDLDGIRSEKIDKFIEGLKDASLTPIWRECKSYALEHLNRFAHITKEDINSVSPKICTSITLSTLHGCPPNEIERIAVYLLKEKKLNTFIKCNPTLLGYDTARDILDDMGYDYISFGAFHFRDDLQFVDAVPMIQRLLLVADEEKLCFGVKLTNTFPVDIKANELPGEEMYMSGHPLYPLTLAVVLKLTEVFDGKLRISYSGGADYNNIAGIFNLGIWPITIATTILKPGGYHRMVQIAQELEKQNYQEFTGVNIEGLSQLCEASRRDKHHRKAIKPLRHLKIKQKLPLTNCFMAPCIEGCPIHQDITVYMRLASAGNYFEALKVITEKNPLPFITGTICGHRCTERCTRNYYEESVRIREMKKKSAEGGFSKLIEELNIEKTARWGMVKTKRNTEASEYPELQKAAVIGGGPAGMAAGFFLARMGVEVTIFEKKDSLGGVVKHIIPDFRISNSDIEKDITLMKAMGVRVKLNSEVTSINELREQGYQVIILAVGAWGSCKLPLEKGSAYNALEFLEQYKKDEHSLELGESVAVIGGGNTAMDTARAAARVKGVKKVSLIYRRTKRFMPAEYEELQMAIEDGVELRELLSPLYHNNGILYCRKMVLGDRDASGRRSPKETNEIIEVRVDSVIAAVGEQINKEIYQKMGLFLDDKGHALVNWETLESSLSDVFVIGDGLNGSASVVEAIRDASIAVKAICAKYDIDSETESEKEAKALVIQETTETLEDEIRLKKGVILDQMGVDAYRCLQCQLICENCVDVCPNRANLVVKVPGMKMGQIIHLDFMCNECGNCQTFCPYDSAPYKDKFTLFHSTEAFGDSKNEGFVLLEEEKRLYRIRLDGRVTEEAVFEASCTLPDEIKAIIQSVDLNYRYCLCKVVG